jgi:hypothetical protein
MLCESGDRQGLGAATYFIPGGGQSMVTLFIPTGKPYTGAGQSAAPDMLKGARRKFGSATFLSLAAGQTQNKRQRYKVRKRPEHVEEF